MYAYFTSNEQDLIEKDAGELKINTTNYIALASMLFHHIVELLRREGELPKFFEMGGVLTLRRNMVQHPVLESRLMPPETKQLFLLLTEEFEKSIRRDNGN